MGEPKQSDGRSLVTALLRLIGLPLFCGGTLLVVAGLVWWAMGWRYGGVIAAFAGAWGLPFVALGAGLTWMNSRPAGLVAIVCGATGLGLLVLDGFILWTWIPAVVDAAAVLLGIGILMLNRRRPVS